MFTGSGMPMRFADLDGSMIDVYQAATQMTDESGQTVPAQHQLAARQRARPRGLLRRLHREHAHRQRLERGLGRDRRLGAVARRAGRLGAADAGLARRPQRVLVQRALLEREQAELQRSAVGAGANGLRGMVPTTSSVGALTDGEAERRPDPHHHADDQGRRVRVLRRDRRQLRGDLRGRRHRAGDLQRRRLGSRATAPPTITWDTDEASDSRVDYGTSPGSLTSQQSSPGLVTSHSVQLTGLAPNTTYHYRVTSPTRRRLQHGDGAASAGIRRASPPPRRASPTPRSPTSAPAPPTPTPTSPRRATARSS